ncbi:MAG: rod shape-determining protein RodA [Gemmatimonadetes bacterium]|nr:rod shape-determining protein RodA [Gemmatimonadota bacterium]
MRSPRSQPRLADRVLVAVALVLAVFGIFMIYSAGAVELPSQATGAWRRQALWLALSLIAFAIAVRVPLRWLEWAAPALYGGSLLLLVAVLVVGSGVGGRSWIRLGSMSIQPAEFAKLGTVLMLARLGAGRRPPPEHLWDLWPYAAAVLVPTLLVMAQPDLGTATIFAVIFLAAAFWSGLPIHRVVLVVSPLVSLALAFSTPLWAVFFVFVVAFVIGARPLLSEAVLTLAANVTMGVVMLPLWHSLAPYQQARILAFLQPEVDPQGAGWHLIQSRVAIGSGGWFGKGFGEGTQKRLAFIPEQHTDFIFSVVGEELGFLGAALVLSAFAILLWRVLRQAERADDRFASVLAFGIFAMWFAHVAQNVGMTVGLTPITGIPLPFLSYGGSFLIVSFLAIAILERIALEERSGA